MKIISAILYILIFIPLWAIRYAFGISRFGPRFHNKESVWDIPIVNKNPIKCLNSCQQPSIKRFHKSHSI